MFRSQIKSRLWIKGSFVVLLIVDLCSLSIALYCIPLTWENTYRMEEKFALSLLDRVRTMVESNYLEIEPYRKLALEMKKQELKDIISAGYEYVDSEYKASVRVARSQRHLHCKC